jgi:parallel beta-helix repeat protein
MKLKMMVTLTTFLFPLAMHASDGQTLIAPSIVMAQGGFPYTITQPGSYKLIGNLVVPDVNTSAIVITADNVTIDLNGFSILGPAVCTGCPATCSPAGTGVGIQAGTSNFNSSLGPVLNGQRGISISNGVIKGMGNIGIIVGASAQIRNVTASSNGGYGIVTHSGSTVLGNTANGNGNIGFFIGAANVVSNNTALGNNSVGMEVFGASIVSNNAVIGSTFSFVIGGPGPNPVFVNNAGSDGGLAGGSCGLL